MKNSRLIKGINDFLYRIKEDRVTVHASSTAFFFFLSLAPTFLILCALVTYTPYTAKEITEVISEFVPSDFIPALKILIDQMYVKAHSVMPIAIILAIWSAAKGMMALQRGLNEVKRVTETRNYILVRLQACLYTVIILITFLANLFLASIGKEILQRISRVFPNAYSSIGFLVSYRFILGWVIFTLLFAAIFAYVPNKKERFVHQIPGAAFAAIGWQLFSFLFGAGIEYFDTISAYGSLSIIVLIMIWLYFGMYLLFLGADLNNVFGSRLQ